MQEIIEINFDEWKLLEETELEVKYINKKGEIKSFPYTDLSNFIVTANL